MEKIQVLIDRILDRSSVDAEIAKLPNTYTDGRGPILAVHAAEEISRTMDMALIVARHVESMNLLVDELQMEIHLLRNRL